MIEIDDSRVRFNGDDVWVNGDLISRCDFDDVWTAFLDNDIRKEFETLEEAVKYCLEQGHR